MQLVTAEHVVASVDAELTKVVVFATDTERYTVAVVRRGNADFSFEILQHEHIRRAFLRLCSRHSRETRDRDCGGEAPTNDSKQTILPMSLIRSLTFRSGRPI